MKLNRVRACSLFLAQALLSTTLVACSKGPQTIQDPAPPADVLPQKHTPIVVPAEGVAFVTNNGSDQMSVIDLASNTVVQQPVIARDPIANNGPHHVAIDAKSGFAYSPLAFPPAVAAAGPHAQHGASVVPGILLQLSTKDLARTASLTVDLNPGDVKLTPDGSKVLVSHFDLKKAIDASTMGLPVEKMRATLMVIDAKTMQPIVDVTVCVAPHGIDVSPDGNTVYLACYGEDAIGVVHLDDPMLTTTPAHAVERFYIGGRPGTPASPTFGPYSIVLSDGKLYVGETEGKSFDVIDPVTKSLVRAILTPGHVFFPVATKTPNVWIVPTQAQDALLLIDVSTGAMKGSRTFDDGSCVKPHQAARLGDRFFLVCEGDHKSPSAVLEIDPATLATKRAFAVGVYPDSIAFLGGPSQ